jgi:hypothetical protein
VEEPAVSVASIDLAQLAVLVQALDQASDDVRTHRWSLTSGLDRVMLGADELHRLDAVHAWIDRELPGLQRRLALARFVEAQTPGFQGYVQLDESTLPTTTPAEARALADRAAKLIDDYDDGDLPPELLDLLSRNATDPYFAHQLATQVTPDEVADLVLDASEARRRLVGTSAGDYFQVNAFDERYDALLDGLGAAYGTATFGTGGLALPDGYAATWSTAITDPRMRPAGTASALGLIVSRGTFAPKFLETLATDVYRYELETNTPGMWYQRAHPAGVDYGAIEPVFGDPAEPNRVTDVFDPLAGILAAVGRSPEAGHALFGRGERVAISGGGKSATTNAFLEYVLAQRRWPVDDGAASNAAIAAAITPFEGGDTISATIAGDARAIIDIRAAEIEEARANANPFSDIGHMVLDLLGLVPVIGEPVDGINAVWYGIEGKPVDAALSSASMIPVIGWGATAGRWTRRALTAEEIAKFAARGFDITKLERANAAITVVARADGIDVPHLKFTDLRSFNRAAKAPHPDALYEYNGLTWATDARGRTKSVAGTVSLGKGGRNSSLTAKIGKQGITGDIGFHLIADSLGGPTNRLNVLPGNGMPSPGKVNLNQGEWSRMENKIREALGGQSPSTVEVHIEPLYKDANVTTRPDEFVVELKIDGQPFEYKWSNSAQPPR